jgi:isoaspartyl peptidase/L-asparaginase-like protein (Ntn-hydrolase superfamily)
MTWWKLISMVCATPWPRAGGTERGGPALDAVEEAVVIMEARRLMRPRHFLNRDGKVQLVPSLDGNTCVVEAGCVERIANPARRARF